MHFQHHPVGRLPYHHIHPVGVGMLGDICQRLLADMENCQRLGIGHAGKALSGTLQVDRNQGIGVKLIHQPLKTLHQVVIPQLAGAQVQDVGADVADGAVQIADCLLNPLP